jgi:hypothetical protein
VRAAGLFVAAVLATVALPCAAEIPTRSQHYSNPDYQFSADIPDHLLGCVSENTDHGVDILLDHQPGCGTVTDQRPYADVFASYNVATNAVTPQMLAQVHCGYEKAERTVWLSGWTLGGRHASGCRQYFNDGRITVEIVTQRKTEPLDPEIWIDISASLTTTVFRYERDMRVFREIVRTVRIAPDGPLK